ncbi:hypothetical protein AMIS_20200 [Actinoplanes missouriensis 431]|uniref:Uncharacterized protein n=1 Tax=Actinoplanes missouriensis (strain ATCC 14538 / DSM 43046 / CBS 188.64 / JCM 3121 / NBRC 102363 / NCIMB 12654 / NRRL B-3342 / UNCC 431) TaxID=512565 RepID=I0H2K3_ACTM4|nr:hypothetical protein [Actinoplanes missouriensis]BAL87240.1 hypothetical protein AMIS_20200 [Actinoplanes missouriensis 431]
MTVTWDVMHAEALFVSDLQPSDHPSAREVQVEVMTAILRHGVDGCADLLAQEYGEHHEQAAQRMRWCLDTVADAYQPAAV